MKCPQCNDVTLVMAERQGVEIDYCPQCRGVWLDRGELDKILERASAEQAPAARPSPAPAARPYDDDRYREEKYYRKKKSIWHEIFD